MKVIKVGAMWCPACIKMGKFWKEFKDKYTNVEFIDLDLDMDEDEVKPLNIGNILPEIIVYDNDSEIKRIIGEKNQSEIEKELGGLIEK